MPMEVDIVKAAGQKRLDLKFLIKNMGDKGLNGIWRNDPVAATMLWSVVRGDVV